MVDSITGDDLLKVFKEVNVQLLHLNPNIIKGWFDTDDRNMKQLLCWMCTSISGENYISPLESQEFSELQSPLVGQKYEQEVAAFESKFPGIFDVDGTTLDIEILEEEIALALEEEQRLNNLIQLNEGLQITLPKQLDKKTKLEINTGLKLKDTQECCNNLAEQLDLIFEKHHQQLLDYGKDLYDFEFHPDPKFINSINPEVFQKKFSNLNSTLMPVLENPCSSRSLSSTCLGISNLNETLENNIITMRFRILSSLQNLMISNIEKEKATQILNYLIKTDLEQIVSLTERPLLLNQMDTKEEVRRRMYAVLEEMSTKKADHQVSLTKLKYTQHELQTCLAKFDNLLKLEERLLKLLSYYFLLHMLYIQEKQDVQQLDKYFRSIVHYVGSNDLQDCIFRIKWMKEVIEEYNNSEKEDSKLVKSILKIVFNEKKCDLTKGFQIISDLKKEICLLESNLFSCDNDYKSVCGINNVQNDIKILQQFLICGPTVRVVSLPSELQISFREVEENLKKQFTSIKVALELTASIKKRSQQKWEAYRRQLWIYFCTEPHKLKFILQQIQEECAKLKPLTEEHS